MEMLLVTAVVMFIPKGEEMTRSVFKCSPHLPTARHLGFLLVAKNEKHAGATEFSILPCTCTQGRMGIDQHGHGL